MINQETVKQIEVIENEHRVMKKVDLMVYLNNVNTKKFNSIIVVMRTDDKGNIIQIETSFDHQKYEAKK